MPPAEQASHPPGTWAPARRAARAIRSPIQSVLAVEAASGVLLLATTVVALLWANLAPASYDTLWHTELGISVGSWSFVRPLHFWVNDGLMTVFFFVVGLEIRREIYEGELATVRKAALPIAAAIGGMMVPAAIFFLLNAGRAGARGWAIPMATDIAFAIGVLTLLGPRIPSALRILLLALAVIDDIGSIAVIALFYNTGIALDGVALFLVALGAVLALRSAGVRATALYVVAGTVMWAGILISGVHPTIVGVVLGLLTPVRPWFGRAGFAKATQAHLDELADADHPTLLSSLAAVEEARREAISPGERLIHVLHPWVAFVVMPIFALANAGVPLGGAVISGAGMWLFLGIVLGLSVGKPLGIVTAALAANKLGIATRSAELGSRSVMLVGLVGGIGFTMSLFIAQLAFPAGPLLDTAKLAILLGSAVAIVAGLAFGAATYRRTRASS